MFCNYVAFLAGDMAPGTRCPHHNSELTSCYHDSFVPWDQYHNNIVLFVDDSRVTQSHLVDPTDCVIKGFYCISNLRLIRESIFFYGYYQYGYNQYEPVDIDFLAATKQLYEWFSPSVRLSLRHTFLTMFPSSYHHEIFRSYYQWQKWRPCKRSRSKRSQPNLTVSGL